MNDFKRKRVIGVLMWWNNNDSLERTCIFWCPFSVHYFEFHSITQRKSILCPLEGGSTLTPSHSLACPAFHRLHAVCMSSVPRNPRWTGSGFVVKLQPIWWKAKPYIAGTGSFILCMLCLHACTAHAQSLAAFTFTQCPGFVLLT